MGDIETFEKSFSLHPVIVFYNRGRVSSKEEGKRGSDGATRQPWLQSSRCIAQFQMLSAIHLSGSYSFFQL
jgi:hypothetical protein